MQKNTGFTLIELSIVILIIGLLAGGILLGQDLIQAARLQKTVNEITQLNTAINTFEEKFGCLPGDCTNATAFFGSDPSCPAGSVNGTGTCNGNGDGIVGTNLNGINPTEDLYALNQLALAGLIPGKYPTGPGSEACCKTLVVGSNVPVSSYSPNVGYVVTSPPSNNYLPQAVPPTARNVLSIIIGAAGTSWGDYLYGAGLTAPAAYKIDQKIDDGMPSSGKFLSTDAPFTSKETSNTTCLSGSLYSQTITTGCTIYSEVY